MIIVYIDDTPAMSIKSFTAKTLRIIEGLKDDGYRIKFVLESEERISIKC